VLITMLPFLNYENKMGDMEINCRAEKMRLNLMKMNVKQKQSSIHLSTYTGGASERLQPWVGDPCLVYQTVSKQWNRDDALNTQPTFKFGSIDNEKAPILFLETRVGNCFHYAVMDLSDPVLWKTLDTWKRKRGLVLVRGLAAGVSVGACPLTDEAIAPFERYRRKSKKVKPGAFTGIAQSFLQRGVFEAHVAERLREEGGDDGSAPVVEVQILSSAAIRTGFVLSDPCDTAGGPPLSGVKQTARNDNRTLGLPLVTMGTLHKASEFVRSSTTASSMKPDTPVLGSPVDIKRFLELSRVEGTFGFGHFRVDGRIVLSMRLQSGAAQIYWLADSADPSLWAAIDVMKKNQEVGFMLEEGRQSVFVRWDLPPNHEDIRVLRAESLSHPGGLCDAALELANSGLVEANATTDIPGIELKYVHVNVLASESVHHMLQAIQASLPDRATERRDQFEADITSAGHSLH
jgi:hypothetical protein